VKQDRNLIGKPVKKLQPSSTGGVFFPDDGSIDAKYLNQLTAEAVEYVHGDAREQIVDALNNTDNTPEAVAAITYKVTKGIMERHKKIGLGIEADLSHALALGSEVNDMLVEIIERTQPNSGMDFQKLREESMLRATVMHGEDADTIATDDDREQAQVMFAGMMQDGSVDEGFKYVNQRSAELGLNPNDMLRTGGQAGVKQVPQLQAKQRPIAQGVQQGVRNMQEMPTQAPPSLMGSPPPQQAAPPPQPPLQVINKQSPPPPQQILASPPLMGGPQQ
jgi:hypothetical protein